MTRTERASYPRAIVKDRSEPKNAMDKHIPKNGAGPHNWGSLEDEPELEAQAEYDEEQELQEDGLAPNDKAKKGNRERRASSVSITEEDREKARQIRTHALERGDVDLTTIARTSAAVSTSPPTDVPVTTDANTAALRTD